MEIGFVLVIPFFYFCCEIIITFCRKPNDFILE